MCWQMTIKKFTAVWLPLIQPGKLARDNPWSTLPVFSIALTNKICQWLVNDTAWVPDRKEVYP
jgi:hypothetical protein